MARPPPGTPRRRSPDQAHQRRRHGRNVCARREIAPPPWSALQAAAKSERTAELPGQRKVKNDDWGGEHQRIGCKLAKQELAMVPHEVKNRDRRRFVVR